MVLTLIVSVAGSVSTAAGQEIRLAASTAHALDLPQRFGSLDKSFITESTGGGAAFLDYDQDGWVDLFVPNGFAIDADGGPVGADPTSARGSGAGHRLYRSAGGVLTEAPASAGLRDVIWGAGVTQGDVDNDGWPDLFVTAIGGDRLYRNNGDGTFTAWPSGVEDAGWGAAASLLDWDADGSLDLFVARYVDLPDAHLVPKGAGRCFYSSVEAFCGPEGLAGQRDRFYRGGTGFVSWRGEWLDPEAGFGLALAAFDCDDDTLPEVYVANDSTMNALYRRDAEGVPRDEGLLSGAGYSGDGREQAGMGVTVADADHDGRLDLFVTNFQNDHNTYYRNLGGCLFQDETELVGLAASSFPYMGWGALFLDVDGDADQDLFVANGHIHPAVEPAGIEAYRQRNLLYRNRLREDGDVGFEEIGAQAGGGLAVIESSRGAIRGDLDGDGDFDLIVTNIDAVPTVLRNVGDMALPALQISLRGRDSNRSAYGATAWVTSGGVRQRLELRDSDGYAGANDPRLLVFLPSGRAEELEIHWPGGHVDTMADLGPGRILVHESVGLVAQQSW